MANPLFQDLGGNGPLPGPMGNFAQMMQSFNQFRSSFKGDPKETVMNMVASGRISQEQLNQAQQAAQQFQQMLNGMK